MVTGESEIDIGEDITAERKNIFIDIDNMDI